ncbi:manganese efflux pump MntP [Alicyclobacillus sp. ALC3]|uniref:manganese efflux pump MntP n=1 Tax=Alicyclobacillus sp. ALC3 TaxID=2796143 RepID=UPI00237962AB|nr:manganese efflux pump [Alicyclobacillus sp. ALC3]WDL95190.1 manganese efflux pump [Alicyclobacillus sp. ALC3]
MLSQVFSLNHVHDGMQIFMMAIALGMDAFSLAVGLGLQGLSRERALRLALLIGIFHVGMTLGGLYAGMMLHGVLGQVTKWFSGALLIGLALHMIYASLFHRDEADKVTLGATAVGAVLFAGGVSFDALSVGFSLGLRSTAYGLVSAVVFGAAATVMVVLGVLVGKRANALTGTYGELIGAAILLGYGLHFLLQ